MANPPPGFIALTTAIYDLRMCRETLLYHIKKGRLHAEKRDGRWWIKESELRRWLGVNDPDSLRVQKLIQQENTNLLEWPTAGSPEPKNVERADVDFLVAELRRKVAGLESDNRRLMDQNLRFRSVIRGELELWQALVQESKPITYGEAKRHVNTLLGTTHYNGRDEGPLEYREPITGGTLQKRFERLCRGETDESEKPPTEPTIIDLEPRPQYIPDPQGIRAIKKNKERKGDLADKRDRA
jgi:hypothetical protein